MTNSSCDNCPTKFDYVNGKAMQRAWTTMFTIAAVWALISIVYLWPPVGWKWWPATETAWHNDLFSVLVLVTWAVGPPAWFAFEYHHYLTDSEKSSDFAMKRFKQGQELTRNVWVGIGALILALYFKSR